MMLFSEFPVFVFLTELLDLSGVSDENRLQMRQNFANRIQEWLFDLQCFRGTECIVKGLINHLLIEGAPFRMEIAFLFRRVKPPVPGPECPFAEGAEIR